MKFRLITLLLFSSVSIFAQTIVTTTPTYPTQTDQITITFDVTNASHPNKIAGYFGNVYAHTGVTLVTNNGAPERWQKVKGNWGDNTIQPQLTYVSTNIWKITINNPRNFYNVTDPSQKITELSFVLRSSDGSKQTEDIFVPLYESGITFVFKNPIVNNSFGDPLRSPVFVQPGGSVDISVSIVAIGKKTNWLYLYVDDVLKRQIASSSSIDYKFIADDYKTGRHDVKIVSIDEGAGRDSTSFIVFKNPAVKNIPLSAGNQIGINYGADATKVTLVQYAPNKNFIYVIGDFNDWKVDTTFFMNRYEAKPDSVIWWATINVPDGVEQAYQFLIDGDLRIFDPYADKILDPWNDKYISSATYPNLKPYPNGKTENIVSVLQTGQSQYNWKSGNFNRPSKEKLVIYEMLVRDFVSTHSYKTLADTLSYFKKLGVNAIELMPISEFEGNDSWGYNPMTYFAPDKYYGTKDDLKKFIDACHQNGIAVILDIVLNHAYGLNPMVRMYWDKASGRPAANNPWFNQQSNFQNSDAQWGYDFNHESKATQYFVDRVLKYWLTEYKMDGFRFDFTKGFGNNIKDRNSDPWGSKYDADRIRLLKRMVDKVWSYDPTAIMTFEHLAENSEETELVNYGILLWGNMNYNYNEATMGWLSNSNFSGISYKQRGWNVPNLVGYMESHDEERLMYKNLIYGNSSGSYNIKNLSTALSRIELASVFFFTVPGPKLMWQFGELGYDISINQGGRLSPKPIRWYYMNEPDRKKLFNTFAALIRLKKKYPAFSSADFTLNVAGAAKKININHSSMNVAIIGNFDLTTSSISPSFQNTGKWYEFFTGDSINVTDVNMQISLQAGEYKLYTSQKIPKASDLITNVIEQKTIPTEFRLEQNYPNPFNPSTVISWQLAVGSFVTLKVYDILGREVVTLVNEYQQPGTYNSQFSPPLADRNLPAGRQGSQLSSGVYFYTLRATAQAGQAGDPSRGSGQSFVQTKKMLLLK